MPNSPHKKSLVARAIAADRHLSKIGEEDNITKQAAYLRAKSLKYYVPIAVKNGIAKSRAKDTTMIAWVRRDHLAEWCEKHLKTALPRR